MLMHAKVWSTMGNRSNHSWAMHSISMEALGPPGSLPAWMQVLAGLGSGRNCLL
jgi:hypothetical protein